MPLFNHILFSNQKKGFLMLRLKVSEYLFFLEIEKYCFFLHKTTEKPYLNLHFKFYDFFHEITRI